MREVPPTAGLPLHAADLAPWGDDGLETLLAAFLGVERTLLTCSGTAALVVALTALRRLSPQRSEVVLPGYTCALVLQAVLHCGLRPRVCDLAPGGTDFDPDHLAALCGGQTLAVVPTHLCGRVADVEGAARIARAHGAWVIEDAAQALGARVQGRSVGLAGDVALFSLAAGKGLTLFEGGLLVARDAHLWPALEQAAARLLPARWGWELRRSAELLAYAAFYRPLPLAWVYGAPLRRALARGDHAAAAGDVFDETLPLHAVGRWRRRVGARALPRLGAFLDEGRVRWAQRRDRLAQAGLGVLGDSPAMEDADGVRPVLLVRMESAAARDRALASLWPAGLGVSVPFARTLAHDARFSVALTAEDRASLHRAEALARSVLTVSNSPWLDDGRFGRVLAALKAAARAG
ncbi:DegT/DnrJ/EryC1/StrS family aminotransferase [Ramlibacter humi]|uniref:Nucleotide sugar aminotransferase n=1 Tax=Ramlibacter humi TaxID=2530451 RepID=A0A4Z0CDZ8_9BURK|nr:DegT/DnrJ/EryC1/StrS family aminotransferase [Ramlibacter humi]TFZ08760.1 nucleotide sugar aminotransferase [Ramlibacter humi]